MKRMVTMLLSLAMVLGLAAGCGTQSAGSSAAASTGNDTVSSAAHEESAEPAQKTGSQQEEAASDVEETTAYTGMTIEENETMFPLDENKTYTIFYPFAPPLIMMGYEDPADLNFFKTLQEMTNVTLDFTTVSVEAATDNFSLMVAGGDYTDIFSQCMDYYNGGMAAALKDEVILDLSGYMAEYAPHFSQLMEEREDIRKNCRTDDGQIGQFMCAYDNSYVNQGYFVRTDWLEEAGLDTPVTYDDWFEALSAFKSAHNMKLPSKGVPYDGFYGVAKDDFVIRDGKAVYIYGDDEIQKPYLALCDKWFSAGLYNVESQLEGTYTDTDIRGMINSQDLLLATDDIDNYALYADQFPIQAVSAPVVNEGDKPYQTVRQETVGNGNAITTACDDVETLVAYMDFWYSDDVVELANWGNLDETYTIDDQGNKHYTDEVLNFVGGLNLATSVYCAGWEPTIIDWNRKNVAYSEDQLSAIDTWNDFDTSMNYPTFISFTPEESQIIQTTYADIQTYADENYTMFKVGEKSYEQDFKAFQDTLYSMGLQDVIDCYQAAYDRYQER